MTKNLKILIIDNNIDTINSLSNILKNEYKIENSKNIEDGLNKIQLLLPDLILLNINISNLSHQEIINDIKKINNNSVILLLIENEQQIPTALQSMNNGAYDYILKPLPSDRLKIIVSKALEKRELNNKVELLKARLEKSFSFSRIIGNSNIVRDIYSIIKKVASHNISVLITGESGTGKELIARVIHYEGNRSNRSFIPLDCSTLPETLFESEIFGHEKGAFTGAHKMNLGKVELAQGGTLFLDEIGNLPINLQIKLLRLLQEKEIERIGGRRCIKIDARIIAATNIDLHKNIAEKKFREDLFYRLNEFSLHIPPLRERKEDIPLLMKCFLDEFNLEFNKDIRVFSKETQDIFFNYLWPGNIRELKNVIKRAVILAEEIIDIKHLPIEIISKSQISQKKISNGSTLKEISRSHLEDVEKSLIIAKLNETRWNKRKAAALLDIDYKTLFNKMNKYNIQ